MYKVLVVDDEDEIRAAIERRLTRDGLYVDTASSEAEALEKLRDQNNAYDVVLTDMVMESPDSGMKVLQTALEKDIFTEVIVLTAYGNVANAVECMKRGAFDYIEKNIPGVDVYDLISMKVSQALERRRSSVNIVHRIDRIAKAEAEKAERRE